MVVGKASAFSKRGSSLELEPRACAWERGWMCPQDLEPQEMLGTCGVLDFSLLSSMVSGSRINSGNTPAVCSFPSAGNTAVT